MVLLSKFIAVFIFLFGFLYLFKPESAKKMIVFWSEGKKVYLAGVIRLALAVILFLAASQCRRAGIVVLFGVLFLLGGFSLLVVPLEKMKSILKWAEGRSLFFFRVVSLLPILIGILLLYAI